MTLKGLQCVVFDLDDTLYLERDYVRSGFCAVGRYLQDKHNVTGFASRAWREFVRGTRGNTFDIVLAQLGVEGRQELIPELVEVYRGHQPAIALEPDALDCLQALQDRVKLALITDGAPASQRAKIASLGLQAWMDLVIVTEEQGTQFKKPHPASFERVQRELGVSGAACMYVGDNPVKDFVAPRALGWRTLRCRRAGGLHADVQAQGSADLEMTDLSKVASVLAEA